jgi:GGDEF domain-containing protein
MKRSEAELNHLVRHDPLTELPKRETFAICALPYRKNMADVVNTIKPDIGRLLNQLPA